MPKGFTVELEMGERHEYSALPPPPRATVVPRTQRAVVSLPAPAPPPPPVKQHVVRVQHEEHRQITQQRQSQRQRAVAVAGAKCAMCSQPGAVTLTGQQYEALTRHCDQLTDALKGFEQRFKQPVIVRYTMRRPIGGPVDIKAAPVAVPSLADDEPSANTDEHNAAYESVGASRPVARVTDEGHGAPQTDEYYGTVELQLLLRDAERMLATTAKDVEMAASLTGAREQTTLSHYDHELLRLKDQVRRIRKHLSGEHGDAADDKEDKPCANLASDVVKLEHDAAKLRAYYKRQKAMV